MKLPCDHAATDSKSETGCREISKPWVLVATILGSSMAFIDSTVVNVALPALQSYFHATMVDVQWVVEAYGLFLGALILVGGSLGDLFGRRRIFVAGVAVFAIASAGCGVASSIRQLLLARSVQGLGAALLVPGSLSLISASFDEKSRGKAIGTWSGFTAITTAIGPVLGGWLVQHASWRWIFLINLPLAAAVIVVSHWQIPESRSASAKGIDWLGAVLVTIGLGGIVTGFIESSSLGWGNVIVSGSLVAGIVCLAGFAWVETRVASPMVPLSLFASRDFAGANLLTLFLYSAIGVFFFLFPLNLIQVQGYSPTASGAASLPLILLMFALSRWSGGLVTRYGRTIPLVVGPSIATLGFLAFFAQSTGGNYWSTFFPAVLLLGFGLAVTVAPLTTVVMSSADQDRVGTASGINNAVARVAGVLAIAVLGVVMVRAFSYRLDLLLARIGLPSEVLREIHANAVKLAGLDLPANLDPGMRDRVRESVAAAFVFGFRIIMLICAGLAAGSGAIPWFSRRKSAHLPIDVSKAA